MFRLRAKNVPISCIFCGGYTNARVPVHGGEPARSRKIFHFGSRLGASVPKKDFRARLCGDRFVPPLGEKCSDSTRFLRGVQECSSSGTGRGTRPVPEDFHFWVAYIIPPLYIMGGGLREKFRFRGVLGGVRAGVQVREFGDTAGCRNKPGTT